MAELPLNSLRIENFRGIKELEIERLAQINLLVGKNSVGKTSVLDAIRLYASGTNIFAIFELLEQRNEINLLRAISDRLLTESERTDKLIEGIQELFFGRPNIQNDLSLLQLYIGQITSSNPKKLAIKLSWEDILTSYKDLPEFDKILLALIMENHLDINAYPLDARLLYGRSRTSLLTNKFALKHQFISSSGLTTNQMENLWSQIALKPLENEIIGVLKIIIPDIEQINFIENKASQSKRTIFAKINGERVPFTSLGEGLSRLLAISLSIANAENGILLIDEIENGLHYSVQAPMWRVLLELAHRLNVQIFATTHSEDATQSFQIVTDENKDVEGLLIRLGKYGENIVTTLYDETRLKNTGGVGVR